MSLRAGISHIAILLFFVSCAVLIPPASVSLAQSPVDLYEPGPDPIAPSLPAQDTAVDSEAQGTSTGKNDNELEMLDMPLEQLSKVAVTAPALDMEVSTVSRTESTVGKSPAAVFVITNEMIRRSGATCIPEVLRMVPGLDVARVDSHTWMITSRGFSERFANKLLVLIDGRSVYTPLFSGVYWDSQDTVLEDIERIEVIRGPGATIWGANAVNGVINVITKRASETQGVLVRSGGGNHDRMVNAARYGGGDGRGFSWRVYGKQFERGPGYLPEGAHDGWGQGRGGFRADWEVNRDNTWTVQGDLYGGTDGLDVYEINPDSPNFLGIVSPKENISGANVLTRWTRVLDEESDWALQMYYDRTMRDQPMLRQEIDIFDIDFQHRFSLGSRHAMIWGLEFRQVHDNLEFQPFYDGFVPGRRTMDTISGFIQDQITLVDERLYFIAGTKLEHNDFTGFEYQPSGRLLWTPDGKHSYWGAVSRAVRVPSRFEQDGYLTLYPQLMAPAVYVFPRYTGNRDVTSLDVMAYELGYRTQATEQFSYDIALFYNVYDNLVSFQRGELEPYGDNFILPLDLRNGMYGKSYGVEISAEWAVTPWWRLAPSYSFLRMNLECPTRPTVAQTAGNSPHNTAYLRSYWDLSANWQLDMALRYVDVLPNMDIPSYITMDLRLGWTPTKQLSLDLVGRNLLDRHHFEYGQDTFNYLPTEVGREVYAQASWRH